MNRIAEYTFAVRAHHCGADGRLKIQCLFDFFQDAASDHAELLGCGWSMLEREKKLWVLSRIRVGISRMPRMGSEVTVKTWPSGFDKLFAIRQFLLRDADGAELACGTSAWLLLDAERMRPLRVAQSLPIVLPDNSGEPWYFDTPEKLMELPADLPREVFPVRRSHIDVNQHLNNAFYAAFTGDTLGDRLGRNADFAELQINFQHEALAGDRICCAAAEDDVADFLVDGRSPDGSILYFQAAAKLRSGKEVL